MEARSGSTWTWSRSTLGQGLPELRQPCRDASTNELAPARVHRSVHILRRGLRVDHGGDVAHGWSAGVFLGAVSAVQMRRGFFHSKQLLMQVRWV